MYTAAPFNRCNEHAAAGLPSSWHDELKQHLISVWHGFEQSVVNDAGDKWRKRLCVSCESKKFWEFNSTPYMVMHILFCLSYSLILWPLNKNYCVTCSRILPVLVCCVLQGSGVTPLKCGEIYDMIVFANFMENATVINFENRLTVMNECIVAKFFWDTVQ